MSEQILAILKRKLDDLSAFEGIDAETCRNALKEELQFYVLNFIYHHPKYADWVMYGGSALRIIHGLDRMSVDLDFEVSHAVTDNFLRELEKEIENYFSNTYGTNPNFLAIKITERRGLILKFNVGENLSFDHASKQVHIKIDLNHFIAPKTVTERRPINHDQLSFVILTYNMSALMASKLAAIFLRGTRGVGKAVYEEKGRDIYDLLWYMSKKAIPDLDYLKAKEVKEAKDLRTLFDKLTIKMNAVSDENLKQDLLPLFVNRTYAENWIKNWRESYLRLSEGYEINTVTTLEEVVVHQDFQTDVFHFSYEYKTEAGRFVWINYILSDHWIEFREGDLATETNEELEDKIKFSANGVSSRPASQEKLKKYATLFYQKTEDYFQKTKRIMLGASIDTKLIRMTAEKLNQREQILLNKSALLSCELEDLLR
jgi:hypothetical protein